jgi:hypothetical protein
MGKGKEGALMVNVDNRVEDAWWSKEWGLDELEDDVLAAEAPSMWEAEVAALSDEQLAAMEETAEDF